MGVGRGESTSTAAISFSTNDRVKTTIAAVRHLRNCAARCFPSLSFMARFATSEIEKSYKLVTAAVLIFVSELGIEPACYIILFVNCQTNSLGAALTGRCM